MLNILLNQNKTYENEDVYPDNTEAERLAFLKYLPDFLQSKQFAEANKYLQRHKSPSLFTGVDSGRRAAPAPHGACQPPARILALPQPPVLHPGR